MGMVGTIQTLILLFFAILFLQSGLDKVFDWKGNLSWLEGHFSSSPFRSMVAPLLGILTLLEVLTGVACSLGLFRIFVSGINTAECGLKLAAVTLICLFLGQRMAKDYAGAATLVPYFLTSVFGLSLFA